MDYLRTTKPRVVTLFVVAAWTGYALAGGGLTGHLALLTVGLAAAVAGAAALNSYLERDRDRRMERTRNRPLPSGRVRPGPVRNLGLVLLFGGALILLPVGWQTAAATLAGGLYYVIVYTLILKPRFAHGAVAGGLAGIFPPLAGWTAGAASTPAAPSSWLLLVYLLGVVFLWSPPHFWALTLVRSEEYRTAGLPVPPTSSGHSVTRMQMLSFTVCLFGLTLMPAAAGMLGRGYLLVAGTAGAGFLALVALTAMRPQLSLDRAVYRLSGPYLAALFLAMSLDARGAGGALAGLLRTVAA